MKEMLDDNASLLGELDNENMEHLSEIKMDDKQE